MSVSLSPVLEGNVAAVEAPAPRPLLAVSDLSVTFAMAEGSVPAVRDVSFAIRPGEAMGLVGESGSGKSVTCLAIMRLLGASAEIGGRIRFDEDDLASLSEAQMARVRGRRIAMIFQDPTASLNPVKTIGRQLTEALTLHQKLRGGAAVAEAKRLLERVKIPDPAGRLASYPHELSGGMNQRVMIAMALAGEPDLLIADEPTTALDVTIQAQILELLRDIGREAGMATLLVTHDLGVVAELCDKLSVMYAGRLVETGPAADVLITPEHPYTSGLLAALPRIRQERERLEPIPGSVPPPRALPPGCAFAPRCPLAEARCEREPPTLSTRGEARAAACHLPAYHRESAAAVAFVGARAAPTETAEPVLSAQDVACHFRVGRGWLGGKAALKAVDGVSFQIAPGEAFGLVGESGCGKSTIARLVMGVHRPTAGALHVADEDLSAETKPVHGQNARLARRAQMVFQDPVGALDPRMRVGEQIGEPLRIHGLADAPTRREKALELMNAVGLAESFLDRWPHELSGGQRQRVVLARALILEPDLLVCDEPIAALDVSIQAQVVNLLADIQQSRGLAMLFISHDLRVVRHLCSRIAVMYLGRLVEVASRERLFEHAAHPYSQALLSAVPSLSRGTAERQVLEGEVPSPLEPPAGCRFHPRCAMATDRCRNEAPALKALADGQSVACHVAHGEG